MDAKPPGQCFTAYDTAALSAVVDAMARRLRHFVDDAGDAVLIGILRRGEPLAHMLNERLAALRGERLPYYGLRLKRYADDLTLLHPETELTESPELAARDLSRSQVILVDDVLYRGHSLLRAISYAARLGAQEIRTVVLVDRGAEKLPVRADVVGVRLDVAPGDIVECKVPPYETDFKIDVFRPYN